MNLSCLITPKYFLHYYVLVRNYFGRYRNDLGSPVEKPLKGVCQQLQP